MNLQQLIDKGAYQSWIFGPSLLDENGKAKNSFLTWSYIEESHPRTAIGYFEPGHYCLLLVDGRQKSSRGMFPAEMAKVFENLGCRAAYNLDGGHCSFMTFQDRTANFTGHIWFLQLVLYFTVILLAFLKKPQKRFQANLLP